MIDTPCPRWRRAKIALCIVLAIISAPFAAALFLAHMNGGRR